MHYTTEALKNLDQKHQIHPYMNFSGTRHVISRGEGAYIYDHDGKKYLDGIGGLWCVNVGHGRKEIALAMQKQAETLPYYSSFVAFANEPSILLAEKLMTFCPKHLTKVYFTLGGSEANDAALRIVHHYNWLRKKPEKKHIISRKQAYHGMTYITASLTGIAANNENYHVEKDFIHHLSTPSLYRPPQEGLSHEQMLDFYAKELENKILELGSDKVAAFFAEPIMGAGGVHVAPKGYHKRMQQVCKAHDVLFVLDEVVTGFGRLGEYMTAEKIFDVQPDILTLAKGITSGYFPMGATLISEALYQGIKQGEFTTAFTYSAHPVGAAAALANIEIMERENLNDHVQQITPYLWQRLGELQKTYPNLGDVRGSHFMIGLEFVADPATKAPFDDKLKFSNRIADECFANGLVMRPLSNGINVLSPTLIWQEKEVDLLYQILDQVIKRVLSSV